MLNGRITYWLYHGGEPIASVRGEPGLSEDDVRYLAIRDHQRVPLCYPLAPFEHQARLQRATVRIFDGGR